MNKFTPGPWKAPCSTNGEAVKLAIMYGGEYGQHIADVFGPGSGATRETMHANARLIAASPMLLEALKKIVQGKGAFSVNPLIHASNTIDSMKAIARDAIAEVEGRE